MLFSEPVFLFFFLPVLIAVYFASPSRYKNACLLLFSLVFYAWGEEIFVLVILVMIGFNYFTGLKIAASRNHLYSRLILGIGVAGNLGILVFFKYAFFIASNLTDNTQILDYAQSIHLPIGVSFFTFQALTYLIDLHRREIEVQSKFSKLALYISLFPQLVAGPIVRYSEIEQELNNRVSKKSDLIQGMERFIFGLAKKILIADPLGQVADQVFLIPTDGLSTPVAWLGITCYAMQIFFDFSAYSDMAIGLGRIFGFKFPENFNFPYIAKSVTEFWRRWHMTLSRWFRDYLYIPLGGSRHGPFRTYLNLTLVFVICGLWHGASWNFILWGAYYGIFLVAERVGLASLIMRLPIVMQHMYLLLVVVVGWVPFRAETLDQTIDFLSYMFIYQYGPISNYYSVPRFADHYIWFTLVIAFMFSIPLKNFIVNRYIRDVDSGEGSAMGVLRISILLSLVTLSVIAIGASSYSPFIYFRF